MEKKKKSRSPIKVRKNSPRNTGDVNEWPDEVFDLFNERLSKNISSIKTPYFEEVPMILNGDGPEKLSKEKCHNPTGCNFITVCFDKKQYQRPIHRMVMYLKARAMGIPLPKSSDQASHLCMNKVNVGGKGEVQCCNPNHMVFEKDTINKDRRNCPGWLWINPYLDNPGNFWYPACTHKPPCLRYTPKSVIPTELAKDLDSIDNSNSLIN